MFGLGTLGRRLLEGTVSLFAVLGFLYVPLGQHTGFEHARAVFGTPAAQSAFEELTSAFLDLRTRIVDLATGRVAAPKSDAVVREAKAAPKRDPDPPRPVPPKLD